MCWDLLIPGLEYWGAAEAHVSLAKTITLRGCAFSPGGQRPSTGQGPEPGSCSGGRSWSSPSLPPQASLGPSLRMRSSRSGWGGGAGWGTPGEGSSQALPGLAPETSLISLLHVERGTLSPTEMSWLWCARHLRSTLEFCLTGEVGRKALGPGLRNRQRKIGLCWTPPRKLPLT